MTTVFLRHWLQPLFVDRTARALIICSIVFNVLTWTFILSRLWPLIAQNHIIALRYSIFIGVNSVGPALFSLLIPAAGTFIILANGVFSRLLYIHDRSVALLFLGITFFFELLALTSAVFLVLNNLYA